MQQNPEEQNKSKTKSEETNKINRDNYKMIANLGNCSISSTKTNGNEESTFTLPEMLEDLPPITNFNINISIEQILTNLQSTDQQQLFSPPRNNQNLLNENRIKKITPKKSSLKGSTRTPSTSSKQIPITKHKYSTRRSIQEKMLKALIEPKLDCIKCICQNKENLHQKQQQQHQQQKQRLNRQRILQDKETKTMNNIRKFIEQMKNEIEISLNLGNEIITEDDLMKIPNDELLFSNVKLSDVIKNKPKGRIKCFKRDF